MIVYQEAQVSSYYYYNLNHVDYTNEIEDLGIKINFREVNINVKGEIWKDINGYEGLYQVSNKGRVRSLDKYDSMGRLHKGDIKAIIKNRTGYLCTDLYKNGERKNVTVHRLVAETFIKNPNNYNVVNHIDGDKTNN